MQDLWEYKVFMLNTELSPGQADYVENELNELGHLGWELVSIAPQQSGSDGSVDVAYNGFVFKRKK